MNKFAEKEKTGNILPANPKRLAVAISGASGAQLGIEFLQAMRQTPGWETHLIISQGAERTIREETGFDIKKVSALADKAYQLDDIGAPLASGTFRTEGMIIIPCSMNTLGKIAAGIADNLILRAADVTVKERRKLVLVAREAPLSPIHLRNMLALAETGAVILPPMLAFYSRPASVADLVRHTVGKALDIFQIDAPWFRRWGDGGTPGGNS